MKQSAAKTLGAAALGAAFVAAAAGSASAAPAAPDAAAAALGTVAGALPVDQLAGQLPTGAPEALKAGTDALGKGVASAPKAGDPVSGLLGGLPTKGLPTGGLPTGAIPGLGG